MTTSRAFSPSVELRTNAKLNLFLRVLGRRPDGYHELESIFHSVDLFDTVSLERLESLAIEVRMRMIPELPGAVPPAEDNLVTAVVNELATRAVETHPGLRVDIVKQIPLGSGLGGGSGNAAGVLSALNELWALGIDPDELAMIAARIGADVPFCLAGGTALVAGARRRAHCSSCTDRHGFRLGALVRVSIDGERLRGLGSPRRRRRCVGDDQRFYGSGARKRSAG